MNPCVGAAGTRDLDRCALDFSQHSFKNALYRSQTRLYLPAMKLSPVVADGHSYPAHKALYGLARTGLLDRHSLLAHRAEVRGICDYVERSQRHAGHSQIDTPPATVNDRSGCQDIGAGRLCQVDHFAGSAARGHDIFNYQRPLTGTQGKAAPKNHLPGCIALAKDETRFLGSRHLVPDGQSADGW